MKLAKQITFLTAIVLLGLSACTEKKAHTDTEEEHQHNNGEIVLSVEKVQAIGIETQSVSVGEFHDVIPVSGKLLAASCDETSIVATISGVVHHAQHISEGIPIKEGSVLYYIKSDNLQEGDNAERIRINYLAAKRELERCKPLVEQQIVSQKEFAVIEAEYERARLAYEAVGKENSSHGVAVKSPVTGFMKSCSVVDGDYVEVGTPLMVVTRNQHLYLRAEVPMRYYSMLGKITSAKFRTQYSDEVIDIADLHGTLMSSGKSAVSTSSYVPVTFQLDNHADVMPGAYAEVFLITGQREGVISVPTTAITEEQGIYYVYLCKEKCKYVKQEVELGATDGEYTEVVAGLKGGENVVVKGAVNVKLAGAVNAIPEHNHEH